MADHAVRDHARWSASASTRNFACPGAIALIESLGVEGGKTSRAAAWGTAAHQILERALAEERAKADFLGERVSVEGFDFEVDDEMLECVDAVVEYVLQRTVEYAAEHLNAAVILVEQALPLDKLGLPIEAGGTGDVVLLFPGWGLVEVVDLKTGMGYVDASSPQLKTYALGAMLANPGPWGRVQATIVQPRITGRDPIRSVTYGLDEIFDWTQDLRLAVTDAAAAAEERPDYAEQGKLGEWGYAWLRPGDHCHDTFCPAAGQCPALRSKALAVFSPKGVPAPEASGLSSDKLAEILDKADMVEGWLNAIRAEAHARAERGEKVGEYVLVPKQARRAWVEEDEQALLNDICSATGLDPADATTRKVKSPAQIDKLLGAKKKDLIRDLWVSKSSGTNLVRADKTERTPVPALPERIFTKKG